MTSRSVNNVRLFFYFVIQLLLLCFPASSPRIAYSDTISSSGMCTIIIHGSNNSVAQGACTAPERNPQLQSPGKQGPETGATHLPFGTAISIQAGLGEPAQLIARELEIQFQRAGFALDPQRPKMIYNIEVEPRTVGRILDGPDMVVVTISARSTDPTLILYPQLVPQEYPWRNPDSSARYAAVRLYNLLFPSTDSQK